MPVPIAGGHDHGHGGGGFELLVQIRSVWADNLDQEFTQIWSAVRQYPYAALDTEFPSVVHWLAKHSFLLSPDECYTLPKAHMVALRLIQLGLTLSNSVAGAACLVWEFNFCDFDLRHALTNGFEAVLVHGPSQPLHQATAGDDPEYDTIPPHPPPPHHHLPGRRPPLRSLALFAPCKSVPRV